MTIANRRFRILFTGNEFVCSALVYCFLIALNFFLFMQGMAGDARLQLIGVDRSNLPSVFEAFLLNDGAPLYGIYRMLFPFLSIMPGGFLYWKERRSGAAQYLILRMGKHRYFFSCIGNAMKITCFLHCSLLVGSALLNRCFLPDYGSCEYGYQHLLFENGSEHGLLLWKLFIQSPFLVTLCASAAASLFSALYAGITVMLSFYLPRTQTPLVLAFPAVFLSFFLDLLSDVSVQLQITDRSPAWNPIQIATISFYAYDKQPIYPVLLVLILAALVISGTILRGRKDD